MFISIQRHSKSSRSIQKHPDAPRSVGKHPEALFKPVFCIPAPHMTQHQILYQLKRHIKISEPHKNTILSIQKYSKAYKLIQKHPEASRSIHTHPEASTHTRKWYKLILAIRSLVGMAFIWLPAVLEMTPNASSRCFWDPKKSQNRNPIFSRVFKNDSSTPTKHFPMFLTAELAN